MSSKFVSVLRAPDKAFGATETTNYRFEEAATQACDVKFDYVVGEKSAKVIIYPSGAPVKYLKLRFNGDNSSVRFVYGDQWERSGRKAYLEWRSIMTNRALAWFGYAKSENQMACYGVKTGADCFAFWQIDSRGVTLFLNLLSGQQGTDLQEPLVACEVVELFGDEGEPEYNVARRFAKKMCDNPVLPKEQIFGVNNWYWAYGRISRKSVQEETDYLMKMCSGIKKRPYMILDDGWQVNRTYGKGAYIGGPWVANDRFGDMKATADDIHQKGAKAGIWFRPMLTLGDVPEEAKLAAYAGGVVMDPTHPYTLEQIQKDVLRIKSWGYDLIKHDFTTTDITGSIVVTTEENTHSMIFNNYEFFDKTITTATAMKKIYKLIQDAAGEVDIIGCNTISHLTVGIHSTYRVGNDTSGRHFEISRRNGVNSVMRLPLNDTFYRVDPDCAAFTDMVSAKLNLDYLEMCAITGMTSLASVTPGILKDNEMERINKIYAMAAEDKERFGIADFGYNANPEIFVAQDGRKVEYNWEEAYDGARVVYGWRE